ncbi:hypothetical protein BC827DRAFT_1214371 [Russula dissimulans]|nr:hypothetical protein BC827DRAFT_1214371 [Russula dissimulans]
MLEKMGEKKTKRKRAEPRALIAVRPVLLPSGIHPVSLVVKGAQMSNMSWDSCT